MNEHRLRKLKSQMTQIVFLSFVLCFLTFVFCLLFPAPAYAGLGVSVSGGNWTIGNIKPENVTTTATNNWTATNTGDVPASIYIKVDGVNWHPDTAVAVNKFVLKYCTSGSSNWSSAMTTSDSWLRLLGSTNDKTVSFGLRFQAPTAASTYTSDTMTVTLTVKYFYVAEGEWGTLLSGQLVCVGTAGGYLMWPYDKDGLGAGQPTFTRQWKDENTAGAPTWNASTFVYDYTGGSCASHCTKANYPSFGWAEDLDWQGYTGWRLPTKDELKQLYDYGRTYITYYSGDYWSATGYSAATAYFVSFGNGVVDYGSKTYPYYLRAVRSGQW